ncbi:S-layer homology domain-containing protein [Cohnella mopanensis]|uniref:S-layer homology domain-containing protein n=1 Tax=Cohnella mopanensis TaxID=2911966 RepID=UPI001EF94689|nr:S-layer homology domain-containing protein [Cohnella mopanensis]
MLRLRALSSLLLALIISLTSFAQQDVAAAAGAQAELPFDDITQNYATEAIIHLSQLNIINGTGNRKFEPTKAITRAEFVTMLDKLFAIAPVNSAMNGYSDVPKAAWFYGWVQSGIQLGIVQGISPNLFAPNQKVTRQEAAVLMARALKQSDKYQSLNYYADSDQIDSWAAPFVSRLYQLAMMEGDAQGNFRPQAPITKQEAAVLLERVLQHGQWAQQIQQQPGATIQLGWQYGQTTKQFEQQVAASAINTLSPRWFFLGKSGALDDSTDLSLLTWAHQRGNKVWAMVGNRSDLANTHLLLNTSASRSSYITKLTDAVKRYGIDGLNIDFENVGPEDRQTFTLFIKELAASLHGVQAVLSVNVSPDLGTDWTEAFDYASLGKYADYIVLMGYDEHWGGGSVAGSVSSLPWLESGLKTLLSQVPARKTILALPLYTRDWYSNASGMHSAEWSLIQQNSFVQANKLKLNWNDSLGQYTVTYTKNGIKHWIWLEDGRSLTRKVGLGESYSVAGYGYWYMGGESLDMWTSMRNALKFEHYRF